MKVTVIVIAFGSLWAVSKWLVKGLKDIEMGENAGQSKLVHCLDRLEYSEQS